MDYHQTNFDAGLNADDDFETIGKGQWVNASGVRMFSTDKGAMNRIEAIAGTKLLFNNLPSGINICIGGCNDDTDKRLLFFNWNSLGTHGIYCYDKINKIGYTVLMSADVTGGLNFSKDAYIHSCFVANSHLYWVNGEVSQPRRLNIESGIKAYHPSFTTLFTAYTLPLKQSVISWIRKPPGLPLIMSKVTQTTPAIDYNNIRYAALQFCYRYNYRGNEVSVLSALTNTANYNSKEDTFNAIDLQVPIQEIFEQDILSIDLVKRELESDIFFVVKTWDKENAADAAAIAAHNTGTALSYRFYNDITGYALDNVYKVLPFHNVPTFAYAAEVAKNRAFLGKYIEGYDTPKLSSLAISYVTTTIGDTGISTLVGNWFRVFMQRPGSGSPTTNFYVIRLTVPFGPISPAPVYYYRLPDTIVVPPYPSTVAQADLIFVGSTLAQIRDYYVNNILPSEWIYASASLINVVEDSTITGTSGTTGILSKAFKSGAYYQVAITFYDEYQRKCGVKTLEKNLVFIPSGMVTNDYIVHLDWLLSNTNALNEIPDWAFYYSINITKCLSTRFFVQGAGTAIYATKDADDAYVFTQNAYVNTNAGVAIDISGLLSYKMGYTFNEGDIARVIIGSDEYTLAVIGVDGKYAILELEDIGTLTPTNIVYELATPYKKTQTEIFYEVGNMFLVNNPATGSRTYSVLNGTIGGDVYLISRSYSVVNYVAEAMNINDKFWENWHTDIGRPNTIETIGKQKLFNDIKASDVFLAGTRVNGLSQFSALNSKHIDDENGTISKLQLTNKVQEDGTVLLAVCTNEAVSCYLGEVELFDTQGSAYIAKSNDVIGTTKTLRGSHGTNHPESVFEYNGLLFWYDIRNGDYVQYSVNGLDVISKNKFVRPADLFGKKLLSLTDSQVEALGSRNFIIGGYDPHHKEVLFSIPSTEAVAPKGLLEDYAIDYPYDIYDGKGKTLIYKNEKDKWIGSIPFETEKFLSMDNELYSFKNGALYIHNHGQLLNFYGVQHTAKIMFSNNQGGVRTFLNIVLEGGYKKPLFVHLRTEDPYVQSSDLVKEDFNTKEGRKTTSLYRDRLDPNQEGTYTEKQMKGEKLFGKYLLTMLEYEFTGGGTFDDSFDETFTSEEEDNLPLELKVSSIGNIYNQGGF